jgi:hypothetical protein
MGKDGGLLKGAPVPDPTFAETMVSRFETLLAASAGLKTATVDGVAVSVDDLESKWTFWKKKVSEEAGERAVFTPITFEEPDA